MPFFSVVVPVYKARQWVGRAIESVLAQTFEDFELILVDDGSPDDSAEVIARYTDPRVKLIRQENRGEGGARNRGIEASTGMWLTFLDADDQWLPGFLQTCRDLIGGTPEADVVFTSHFRVDGSGRKSSIPVPKALAGTMPIVFDDMFAFRTKYHYWPMCMGTFALSRSLLEKCGLFPVGLRIGTDAHFIMRMAICSKRMAHMPVEQLLYYTQVGVMAQNAKEKVKQRGQSHYPATLLSIEQWESEGKIPPERRASVRRFVLQWFIPWFIYQKGFDRAYGVAWTMLRRHVSPLRHPICYARALLSFGHGWLRSFPVLRAMARLVTGKGKRAAG